MAATLNLPFSQNPNHALLALATYRGIEVNWQVEELEFKGSKDAEEIRRMLIDGSMGIESPLPQKLDTLKPTTPFMELEPLLNSFDDFLALRTYFSSSYAFGLADTQIYGALRSNVAAMGALKKDGRPHLARWWRHMDSMPVPQAHMASYNAARTSGARGDKAKKLEVVDVTLPNATVGKVVLRFAPEPSGYLHIGHLKAAILNRYLADQYKGKYILRFDDTNPLKEDDEFEQSILKDLEMIGVTYDTIVHTSDHFDKIQDFTRQLIKQGDAFMDDTDGELVKEQRRAEIPSKNRDVSIEENLKRYEVMLKGGPEGKPWGLRAKIDYQHKNGTMRDPVIYRCVEGSHHITGTKYLAYPTYDLACPIIDHLDGVTHALRANEYAAREEQYQWFLSKLGFPRIEIFDFSRIDFVYTVLSKRKLKYLVEKGVVKGWDDPRFPTVRGIRARGMTIDGLKNFIVSQGASPYANQMEWDLIWTTNKKIIDPVAPRYWAVAEDKMVKVNVRGRETEKVVIAETPLHKKNAAIGMKKTVYASTIVVEQEDALSFGDNEEVTMMDWGNAFIRSKQTDASGTITSLDMDLHLEGDFKKTSKKIHWLADPSLSPLIPVTLIDYDYLITKKRLEEDDNLDDIVNPKTEYRVAALASKEVEGCKQWDIIQFERKGFYIYQGTKDAQGRMEFGFIPDGKLSSVSLKAKETAANVRVPGQAKAGSWGKPGPKAAAAASSAASDSTNKGEKINLSNGTNGFQIPVQTTMYSTGRIYGEEDIQPDVASVNMYKVAPVYDA